MTKQAERQGREYWSELVREYEKRAPGESQKSFAERNGVKVDTFRGWLYKMQGKPGSKEMGCGEMECYRAAARRRRRRRARQLLRSCYGDNKGRETG